MVLKYKYNEEKHELECCLAQNNAEYRDITASVRGGTLFRPFYTFDHKYPVFYMGFDKPPVKGPLSILFSIERQKYIGEKVLYDWEYFRRIGRGNEWAPLKTVNETNAFTRSGTVVFAGPQDFTRSSFFGKELYWMRIVNLDGRHDQPGGLQKPVVNGIFINTTRVVQHQGIKNEMLETVAGQTGAEYTLSMFPVISEEVWVNEAGHLAADEQELLEEESGGISIAKDEIGNVLEFWIKWRPVDDFYHSKPEDRHYAINRLTGTISFGDGKRGKVPPYTGKDNVKVNYKIGGGARGNMAPFEINSLRNSIVFVDQVFNPEPSGGGCDTEKLENALRRGPQLLKHRNRAVTAEDFEWLAREASQDIAKVKCLPNMNSLGKKESGCVTVVVVPKSAGAGSSFFPELKLKVEKYLLERAAATVAFQDSIQVIEPVYLAISVYADIVVDDADTVAITEKEAVDRLNSFLNPFTGNFEWKGWEIGQHPHISMFFALLKSVANVNYVENVSIAVDRVEYGQSIEMNPDHMADLPHGIVMNGRHRVNVKVM
jgi:hypothetical protein